MNVTKSTTPSPFVYRHIVSFEETNLVGNVYFTRHLAWQGRCREMFLRQHAPDILGDLARDLRLVTLRVSCEYFQELNAFDEIDLQMSLAHLRQNKIGLDFSYFKRGEGEEQTVAHGFQEIGCMRLAEKGLVPVNVPASLAGALRPFEAVL
ncbi:thioesterase family protein [Bradyrhizobium sp. AUGA SZCCT0431]|uniref:acyl-CoA thioesterase n=1 Tax=Bradyrhizobium sp. AUGA SZCCT0431 TaxID=2807674 RepID=UPI001BA99713|nr:acyl-CoA thioesterase [Bradyrhizobium sp. AUGA SZCCT0431]MBR1147549.1 acyl-CoA thioesterase [Bradyrhizobium sp. AUGA SZCCT0431]